MAAAPLRILGVSGSLRAASTNTGMLRAAALAAKELSVGGRKVEFAIANISDLPLYNGDLDTDPAPAPVAMAQ